MSGVLDGLRAAGVPGAIAAREAPLASAAMIERGITNQRRSSMFLAQVLEESVGLRFFEEIASGREYEGRRDLGNTHPGDGPRYKGRGPIQLTGRANYAWAGRLLGLPLEEHPELAAQHQVGWRIAALYWQQHGLNELADQGAFVTITERINGGLNGFATRLFYLNRVKRVDCRPRRPDPYRLMTGSEAAACRAWDRTRRHAVKQKQTIRALRKRVWRLAEHGAPGYPKGWDRAHRRYRYRQLRARYRG